MIVRRRFLAALGLTLVASAAIGLAGTSEPPAPDGVTFVGPVREGGYFVMVLLYPGGWLAAKVTAENALNIAPPQDAVQLAEGVDLVRLRRLMRAGLIDAYRKHMHADTLWLRSNGVQT